MLKLNLFRMWLIVVGFAGGVMVAAGGAVAGQVYTNCNCTPNTNDGGCPFMYCECSSGQGLGPWATNEYHHNCTNAAAPYGVDPHQWCSGSFPQAMVGSLPKNVTCTSPSQYVAYDYYYNDCTNWNTTHKDFSVLTYCTDNCDYGVCN